METLIVNWTVKPFSIALIAWLFIMNRGLPHINAYVGLTAEPASK